jgi:hypothetical protein
VHCAAAAPEDDEFDLGEFDEEELELDEGEGDFGDIGEVGNFEDFADLGDDEVNNIVAQLGADGVDEDSLQELLGGFWRFAGYASSIRQPCTVKHVSALLLRVSVLP